MTEISVPKLGDNIESAEVVAVLVSEGDQIEKDQALIEVESDKAAVEVPATAAGTVKEIKVAEGDSVSEGQVIVVLEGAGSDADDGADDSGAKTDDTAAHSDAESEDEGEKVEADTGTDEDASDTEDNADEAADDAADDEAGGSEEVLVPKLGDNIESAEVVAVLVSEGDQIEKDQALIEVESDKAAVEIPSSAAGTLESLKVAEGDSVSPGQVIVVLKTAGQSSGKPKAKQDRASESAQDKKKGKATEDKSKKSQEKPQKSAADAPPKAPSQQEKAPESSSDDRSPAPAAPSVRRFARELGVEIHSVKGSGPRGRISKEDVKAFVKKRLQAPASAPAASAVSVPDMPDFSQYGPVEFEKMNNVRKATARQMNLSWTQIPHVTQFDQADITDAEAFRKKFGKTAEKAGGKLTVTAILMKLCALALKRFPQFNASIDLQNEQIIYKQHYHLGVAVDTPRGLLVPVLRDVDQKGLIDIAVEIGEVAKKARDRKLGPDALSGGTFTISNLGGLGTTYFTPIVNWPQVAILGVGRASQQPVWQDGEFVPRQIMPLSISYDHRLIDGADAARFLRWIAVALENPLTLLLEGDL